MGVKVPGFVWKCAALSYRVAGALALCVGLACTFFPPLARDVVVGGVVPDEAHCVRVQRKADHVVVELALGTPPRIVRALFRPDLAVPRGYRALRVFSPRTVESESLFCHGETMQNCTDTLLVTRGPNGDMQKAVVELEYTNHLLEESKGGAARYRLMLEGELLAMQETRYWLSATHLCFDASPAPFGADADVDAALVTTVGANGALMAEADAIARLEESLFHRAGVGVEMRGWGWK